MIARISPASTLVSKGVAAIQELIDESEEETLHLEFKTLSSASASNLAKDDKTLLARAICGLANAEGGTLVIGIGTTKVDGLDVASARQPLANCARLRNRVAAALPELLSPQHPEITVDVIKDDKDPSTGYDVPSSDRRPHMSMREHRYYRRGSDGTRRLEHGEIRDLMLAAREGTIDIVWNILPGPSAGGLRFAISLTLNLRNTGKVPVRTPYIKMNSGGWGNAGTTHRLSTRLFADGSFGIYAPRDVIVHLDDEIALAGIDTGLDFRGTGSNTLQRAISTVVDGGQWHAFRMYPFHEMGSHYSQGDRPVKVAGFYGAENAAPKPFAFEIDKRALLEKFREQQKV
jgi:Schlafen, AlbA_2